MAWLELDSELEELFGRLGVSEVPKDAFIGSRKKDDAYYAYRRDWIRRYYATNETYRERKKMLERERKARLKATDPEWVAREKERKKRRCST